MFSQFSDLRSFASKITSELSLDNLQKEQDEDQEPPPPASQPPKQTSPTSSNSTIPTTQSIIPSFHELNEAQHLLHEKDSQIQFLTSNFRELQEELIQLKDSNAKKEKDEKREKEKSVREKKSLLQDYYLLQSKHHDLELELKEMQQLYQSKYQQEQQQEQRKEDAASIPCESCVSYQSQIETIENDHQLQIENLNKKNTKLHKQNKKFEKELQEAQAQIQALTQAAAAIALLPKVDQTVESSLEAEPTIAQSPENLNLSQLLEDEIRKSLQKENEIQSLQSHMKEMQRECEELKEKQHSQTTKMKEKVKGFIESQRLLQLEKANLTKTLTSKDAEIEQLESKLSSLETNFNQRKDLSSELAERYSDAQRELTKRNLEINQLRETVKTLEKSLEDFEHKTAVKEEELLNLSQSHQSLLKSFGEFKIQSQEFQETEEKKSFKQLLEARKEMNEQVEAYRLELVEKQRALSEMQRRSEDLRDELEQVKSINQSFEEYKLRAQKTLKQANATNTSLNSKLTSLEEETETKTAVIDKLTEDLRLSKIEIDRLQNEISELKTQGSEMSESEKELSESQELLKKVTGERDRYKRELEFCVKRIEESNSSSQSLPMISSRERREQQHPRSRHTPDIVVLGSGSDEDIQLKSDEDGVGIVVTTGASKSSLSRSHLSNLEITSPEAATTESNNLTLPEHSSDLYVIYQLRDTINRLHQELADRHNEMEEMKVLLQQERDNKTKVAQQLDELNAFHERTRKLLNSPESAINIEYLKRCVYRLMVTKELTEKRSLYPVISVILKFTPQEAANVARSIEEDLAVASGDGSWLRISELASNSIGSLFGNT